MMDEKIEKRGRMFFDTNNYAHHVTFDDGREWRRNLPWVRFSGAHWSYSEPDMIRVGIDEWMVMISGHNLEPLFTAIEEQKLLRVRVHPEWAQDPGHERDTFATGIRFVRLSALTPAGKRKQAPQLELDVR